MIENFYYWLLWYGGFSDKDNRRNTTGDREKLTYILRRQHDRMGLTWWFLSMGTIIGSALLTALLLHNFTLWFLVPALLFVVSVWLFIHVLNPNNILQPPTDSAKRNARQLMMDINECR